MTDIALSNIDILDLLNCKCKIILYPDLYKYDNLDQVLGNHEACIILFESKPSYGHWVCITKHGDTVEFFNSYGGYPDDSLEQIDKKFASRTNQDQPYLSWLMINSPYNLSYNEFQFQREVSDVRTCGRHCVVRVMNKNLDIYEYKEKLDYLRKKYDTDYDGVVTVLTS